MVTGKQLVLSEEFRTVAKGWAQKQADASRLEETKTAVLAKMIGTHGDMPHVKAERLVKASDAWGHFINRMVDAKLAANLAKSQMEYIRMKFNERQSAEANSRARRRI